jgi:hypothetical protein
LLKQQHAQHQLTAALCQQQLVALGVGPAVDDPYTPPHQIRPPSSPAATVLAPALTPPKLANATQQAPISEEQAGAEAAAGTSCPSREKKRGGQRIRQADADTINISNVSH